MRSHLELSQTCTQVPGKIQHILCTGNLCTKETYDYLKTLAGDVHIVRGDFDDVSGRPGNEARQYQTLRSGLFLPVDSPPVPQSTSYPDQKVISVGQFRIGLTHGHQVVPWGDVESLALVSTVLWSSWKQLRRIYTATMLCISLVSGTTAA